MGFIAYLNQPVTHRYYGKKFIKRVTRLVILPDYQGIGLGTKLLNWLGQYLKDQQLECSINTTAMNLIYSLVHSDLWAMRSYDVNHQPARFHELDGRITYARPEVARIGVRKASFMYK